jgi:transcriptional regulator with AAA-type ATPase domain
VRKAGKFIRGVKKRSLELLQSYPWPGNIRELRNVIERSAIVCDTENFSVDESWLLRQPVANEPKSQPELTRKLATREKEMITLSCAKVEAGCQDPQARQSSWVFLALPWGQKSGCTRSTRIASHLHNPPKIAIEDPFTNPEGVTTDHIRDQAR